ncbi:MAG: hypothetical protein Kow0077_30790 [Anaerolineae bacterium]
MATTTVSAPTTYTRDRFTRLAFFMLGYFAYLQAALGPAMPFLRSELGLSYTVAGLHITLLAAGMILAGLTGPRLVRRLGRRAVFWLGSGGMSLGAALIVIGRTPPVTITGALVMGWLGTYLLNLIPATLSDQHGPHRATAITEANVAASAATVLPPMIIGLLAGSALTWRGVLWAAMLVWAVAAFLAWRTPVPTSPRSNPASTSARGTLPPRFWLVWGIIVLVVAVEWSVVAWSAEFMTGPVGLPPATASGLMSAYFLAMLIGRVAGSRLTRRYTSATLLLPALGLAFAGFALLWLGPTAPLNVAGLFLAGLGIANLFPLSLAWATELAADQSDRAGALVSLAAGLAILVAPQVLGSTADLIGISRAMGLIPLLMFASLALITTARRGMASHG